MSQSDKDRIRAAFPQSVAVADAFREAFGPGVKLVYAAENGYTIGRPLDESRFRVVTGDQFAIPHKKQGKA